MPLARFDPKAPFIRIPVRIAGTNSVEWLSMVLDTGSNRTVVREEVGWRLGYDIMAAPKLTVATASNIVSASVVTVRQVFALGVTSKDFPVLFMPLPPQLNADGLLGLDFLRKRNLFCNFSRGILFTLPFAQNLLHRFVIATQLFANL